MQMTLINIQTGEEIREEQERRSETLGREVAEGIVNS